MDAEELEADPMRAARIHNRLMDDLDAELRELASPEYQAEFREWMARRERWETLPAVGLRPGVAAHRLTEQEEARLDDEGY